MKPIANPPRFAERFFRWFCDQAHLEGLEGDLYERYILRMRESGATKARLLYLADMLTLIRPSVARPLLTSSQSKSAAMGIFSNYLKTTIRSGMKRKWFSAINLTGLTLGIASVVFISLFIDDELSYDQHISNTDNKFRLYDIRHGEDGEVNYLPIVPPSFSPYLLENFEQVEKAGRVMYDYGGTVFNIGDRPFSEKDGVFAEKSVLEILDLELVEGDMERMDERTSVLLSESLYQKFFGREPFSFQTVKLTRTELVVAGVFKDLPEQSHLKLDYIYPFEFAVSNVTPERMNSWIWQQFYTYVQLTPGTDLAEFTSQMQASIKEQAEPHTGTYGFYYVPYLQNIRDIHLHSSGFEWDIAIVGNYQSILFLGMAALIILVIACLNFVNLTTALALKRAKEVCIRKFVGARRRQLFLQYSMESSLYTLLAGVIALALVLLCLPYFNAFTGKTLEPYEILTPLHLGVYLGALIGLGIVAGAYPALLITSFKPLVALHGLSSVTLRAKSSLVRIDSRQILVGAQYVLSIALIILSLIIQKQYRFLQAKDTGFNKENLVAIQLTRSLEKDLEVTKNAFAAHSNIESVAFCYGTPGGIVAGDGVFVPERSENERSCNMFMVDENYLPTMGMEVLAGRNFDPNLATDLDEAFVLNETAVQHFGLGTPEEAIGEPIHWARWTNSDSLKRGHVIGVVRDFNFKSLHNEMSSVVLHLGPEYFQVMMLRIGSGDLASTISHMESAYRKFEETRPFEFTFIDESLQRYYESEKKLSVLFSIFTLLAILTAAIGLFGLVSFNVVSRAKEISIRKVLGAGVTTVFQLLVKRYFVMVLICLLISAPLAYYFASKWLLNFAYRVSLDGWILVQVAVITLVLTLATVGFQAFKGAVANPSDRLRSE